MPALFFLIAFLVLVPLSAFGFNVPETLKFEMRWLGVKGGDATLEVKNGENGLTITSTAVSTKFVSVFYPVNDIVESTLKAGGASMIGLPVKYTIRLKEGGFKRERDFVFDRAAKKVVYKDLLKGEQKEFDVPDAVYDPLSAFYRVREMDLAVGKSVTVSMFDNKKVWDIEVLVLRRERIKTPAGTFDTVVVQPLLKSEGIFKRKGDLYIWLTDDERKMPVKLESEVKVGSVVAVLVGGSY